MGYFPCDSTQQQSTCCEEGYTCLSNNICMFNSSASIQLQNDGVEYVRGACTDENWNSPSCPKFCINALPPFDDDIGGPQSMSKCPDTSADIYYCDDEMMATVNCSSNQDVVSFTGMFLFF